MSTANVNEQNDHGATSIVQEPKTKSEKQLSIKPSKWQERLLPIMAGLLVVLTIFFFISTYLQMTYLHQSILQMPPIDLSPVTEAKLVSNAPTFGESLKACELEIRSNMEAFIVSQRYHQANVVLMANLWIRYLGFITGMILALVGASFVLGKLREPLQELGGKFSAIDISLRTTSPGIILVLLGVVLMFTTLVDEDYYKVTDGNIYLSPSTVVETVDDISFDSTLSSYPIFSTPTPPLDDSQPLNPP